MRFQTGPSSLSDISGGILASGVVPFQRFTRAIGDVENTAVINPGIALTILNQIPVVGAVAGDRLIVWARFEMTKGATPGLTVHEVDQTGAPGVVDFMLEGAFGNERYDPHAANSMMSRVHSRVGVVTTGGAFNIDQYLASMGSDGTVAIGGAGLSVWLYAGS